MAARLWLLLLSADGVLAALIARLLGASLHLRGSACAALAGAIFVLVPWGLTAGSVLLSARAGEASLSRALLRAALRECTYCTRALTQVILEPWRGSPDIEAPHDREARPVLLVHGIVCNRGIWRGWLPELRAAGFAPVRALNLEPLFADIDTHAACLARELVALQSRSGGARIDVITHSMGGLIVRAALPLTGAQTIRRIVTLACPHHGTRLARHYPSVPTRQMRPDSAWLAALNAAQEQHGSLPITSIYSLEDNLVVPASSARLAGAHCVALRGFGHVGLLGSRAARRYAVAALTAV